MNPKSSFFIVSSPLQQSEFFAESIAGCGNDKRHPKW
jgi:hypothetical protein